MRALAIDMAVAKTIIGMLSIGGTSDDALQAHAANWKIYTDHARQNGKAGDRSKWRIVTWADWPATQRFYELMARFVHPHFQRGSNAPRQQSYDIATSNRGIYSVQSQAAVATEIEKYQAAQSKRAAE